MCELVAGAQGGSGPEGYIIGLLSTLDSVLNAPLPDLVLPLSVVERGYRVVYAPDAVLEEETLANESAEYSMRVRVALRALWALWDKRSLLNPLRFPLFSWQLVSHKVLRYLSFAPLALAATTNWLLVPSGWLYAMLAAGQGAAVLLALGAVYGSPQVRAFSPARYCYYFLLLNCACAAAFARFVRGDKPVLWQPRTG